jgi:hypothetical protein
MPFNEMHCSYLWKGFSFFWKKFLEGLLKKTLKIEIRAISILIHQQNNNFLFDKHHLFCINKVVCLKFIEIDST